MRAACLVIASLILCTSSSLCAEKSWIGKVSDSNCQADHSAKDLSEANCTAACVKNGAKYVFVNSGKVYKIDNQDFAGLLENAGRQVRITGKMKGDSIRVSSISIASKERKGEKSSL